MKLILHETADIGYTPVAAAVPYQTPPVHPHHMYQPEAGGASHLPMQLVGSCYRPHFVGQAPSPMDTTPSSTFHPLPGPSAGGPSLLEMYAANPSSMGGCPPPNHGLVSAPSPEVITVSSLSSAGSNPVVCGPDAEGQQQQHISSGSTHFSLDLGSLESLPLSEMTLSIIGSHLSDTFLCLNSDSIGNLSGGGLSGQGEFATGLTGAASGRDDGLRNGPTGTVMTAMGMEDPHPQSREPSMDSFSCIQHVQDQIRELNQLGAVGGMAVISSPHQNKFN